MQEPADRELILAAQDGNVAAFEKLIEKQSARVMALAFSYTQDIDDAKDVFDGYIVRLATVYQFNEKIFVRLIGQYNEFSKGVEIDPLFSYKLNPFTIFYAGSTHTLTDFGQSEGIVQTGRQFFLKLQYLWRE